MSNLRLECAGPIAKLVLDAPKRRNAMSAAMWRDLPKMCAEIESRQEIDAVTVEGVGGHFSSGADIAEFDEVFADLTSARAYLGAIELGLMSLSRLDRPTLAKLRGSVVGGGLAIALACDLRVAEPSAFVAAPPAKLGLLYGPVETQLLVEAVGPAGAKDLLFSGRTVNADEALRLGLINRCVPATSLDSEVENQLREWAMRSRSSVRGAKKAVRAALAADLVEMHALTEAAALGDDFREGRAAFAQKRPPQFVR